MSAISGTGHGSAHNWTAGFTGPDKCTPYHCKACGAKFYHYYDHEPDIFLAMEEQSVPVECVSREASQA